MSDYKVGDVVGCDGVRVKLLAEVGDYYQVEYPERYVHVNPSTMFVAKRFLYSVSDELEISTHVENVHAAFTRVQQKEATYDALKDARHFEDAVNADVIRQTAYADFFRAFVRFVNENPQIWETLSK